MAFPPITDPEAPPIRTERHIPNSIATLRRRLIAEHQQVTQVGERLVVKISSDAAAFTFRFVGEIQTRIGEFVVGSHERSAGAGNPASLEYGPKQR